MDLLTIIENKKVIPAAFDFIKSLGPGVTDAQFKEAKEKVTKLEDGITALKKAIDSISNELKTVYIFKQDCRSILEKLSQALHDFPNVPFPYEIRLRISTLLYEIGECIRRYKSDILPADAALIVAQMKEQAESASESWIQARALMEARQPQLEEAHVKISDCTLNIIKIMKYDLFLIKGLQDALAKLAK